ncbi:MAG: hypothetical protein JWN99_2272 [Ilumatobacteraceae bacterium]|nr:hypothetical protein [Ilumatobacteraceae bacterium]
MVLDDNRRVVIMGEAKVDSTQPKELHDRIADRYSAGPPTQQTRPPKGRQYEAWKTADALWKLRPAYLWLIAPWVRLAYTMSYEPLTMTPVGDLPTARDLDLG